MDIRLSTFYKVIMFFATIFTLGVGGVIMWFSIRNWPKHVDSAGILLRSGKHFSWGELTDQRIVQVHNSRGKTVGGRYELVFGKMIVRVIPISLKQGDDVMSYINELITVYR